ncbi:MAG: hypothetical protein ACRDBY_13000 [Cetobacterium sp.]
MKITDIGSFYLVEDNDKYYLSTVHSQYNGYEDEEDVACNEITKEVYDAMVLNPPNYVKTPKHVEIEVLKTLHLQDEFPATRRWGFIIGCEDIQIQLDRNLDDYEIVYNDCEIKAYLNGFRLCLAEDLDKDLKESYSSICKKVKFIHKMFKNKGVDYIKNYLYNIEEDEFEEEVQQWEE